MFLRKLKVDFFVVIRHLICDAGENRIRHWWKELSSSKVLGSLRLRIIYSNNDIFWMKNENFDPGFWWKMKKRR